MFLHYLEQNFDKNNENHYLLYLLLSLSKKSKQERNLKLIKQIMAEKDESFGQYEQNDSQEFGIALINKIISIIKNESFSDDDDEDGYETTPEKITFSNLEENKNKKFKDYIKKYHNNEIPLEKMFQFHCSSIKINKNDEINLKFETFLTIELTFPEQNEYDLETLLKFKFLPSIDFFLQMSSENDKKKENEGSSYESQNEDKEEQEKEQEQEKEIEQELEKEKEQEQEQELEKEHQKQEKITDKELSSKDKNESLYNKIKNYIIQMFYNLKILLKQYFCEKTNKVENKTIPLKRIVSLPNVLIISINRALIGKSFNKSNLKFKEILDISDYLDDFIFKGKNLQKTHKTYRLYGVNECSGFFKNYGHYYSYVKVNNIWYKFNDRNYYIEEPEFESKYVVGLYYIKEDFIINSKNYFENNCCYK